MEKSRVKEAPNTGSLLLRSLPLFDKVIVERKRLVPRMGRPNAYAMFFLQSNESIANDQFAHFAVKSLLSVGLKRQEPNVPFSNSDDTNSGPQMLKSK